MHHGIFNSCLQGFILGNNENSNGDPHTSLKSLDVAIFKRVLDAVYQILVRVTKISTNNTIQEIAESIHYGVGVAGDVAEPVVVSPISQPQHSSVLPTPTNTTPPPVPPLGEVQFDWSIHDDEMVRPGMIDPRTSPFMPSLLLEERSILPLDMDPRSVHLSTETFGLSFGDEQSLNYRLFEDLTWCELFSPEFETVSSSASNSFNSSYMAKELLRAGSQDPLDRKHAPQFISLPRPNVGDIAGELPSPMEEQAESVSSNAPSSDLRDPLDRKHAPQFISFSRATVCDIAEELLSPIEEQERTRGVARLAPLLPYSSCDSLDDSDSSEEDESSAGAGNDGDCTSPNRDGELVSCSFLL
jgi:hypothetical protein